MLTFAKTHAYASDDLFDLAFSDDGKAFTLTFSKFEAVADTGTAPIVMRTFAVVLPLSGGGRDGEITFRLSGFSTNRPHSSASLLLGVNGRTAVIDFAANSEQSYIHELEFKATAATECRLSVLLVAGRDSTNAESGAFLNAATIDADIPVRKR
jgi:hypothetical protein